MARPKPGNYAIYTEAGKKRYETALRKYLANKKKAEEARKITSTKKNIAKQKTAGKTTTTKKVKELTKSSTSSTAKKPVTKKPVVKSKTTTKPVTKEVVTKKTVAKKPVAKKPVAKKPVAKKPVAKKPVAKKPVAKKPVAKKPVAKQTAKRGRPVGSKNKPKGNQNLKIAKETASKTGKFLKEQGKKALDTGKKQYGKLKTKLSAKDQTPQQANPEPKTKAQKLMSRINKSYQSYKGQVLDKAGKDLSKKGKLRSGLSDKSLKAQSRGGTRASLAAGLLTAGTNALVNRAFKPKNMTMAEFKAAKEKSNREGVQKFKSRIKKTAGNLVNKVRGKSNTQTSTTKNINKQKKTNNNKVTNPNADKLKIAKQRVRKAKGYNKEKLQREVDYLEKLGKQPRTWSNPYGAKGNNKPSSVKTDTSTKSPRPGSARAKMRAKNEARFGKAHVDKLRAKNRDFQAMKKKKMTKAEFIRRYPNSQTAKRARGL